MKLRKSSYRKRTWIFAIVAVVIAAGLAAGSATGRDGNDDDDLPKQARSLFKPLPKDMATTEFPVTPQRVRLGRMLFFDPRISADGTGSCVRCHQPALYGADGLPTSVGLHDKPVPRNAPTVFNAGLFVRQHWDGQFATVEEQATRALLGPGFGNPDYPSVMTRLKAIPGYAAMFQQAFPD
jgi:cytochrome c peroxidase